MSDARSIARRWHVLFLTVLTLLMTLPGLSSIPLIDRDEARYAQSSVQMVESGDWVEIRLGDEARNKKPVGAYWAQAISIVATGGLKDKPGQTLWAQRLPSVIAGLVAVLLTYLAAIPMIGRRGAVLAGAMLATSLIFVFEAHIAKTDALLLASTTGILAALSRLRAGRPRGMSYLFWGALGASVLIKGPIGPALAGISLLGLAVWERKIRWARPLLNPLAILLFLAIVLPWGIAIWTATEGQFFADSLGGDFGGKLTGAAEDHSGPPGYYLMTVFIALWPACLLLIPGLVFTVQAARRGGDSLPGRGMRLVLVWVIPFWVLLEIAPTKLIHYPLPLFPALCTAMAGAALAIAGGDAYRGVRWVSGVLFIVASAAVIGIVTAVQVNMGDTAHDMLAFGIAALSGLLALTAAIALFTARIRLATINAGLSAIMFSVVSYAVLIPAVDGARTSQNVVAASTTPILSPDYNETSLRYYGGTDRVRSGFGTGWEMWETWPTGTLVLDRRVRPQAVAEVMDRAAADGVCLRGTGVVKGFNYSRADDVELVLLRQTACETVPSPQTP